MSGCVSRGWRAEIKGQDGPEECGEVDLDHSDKEAQDDQFGRASLDEVQKVHDGYCVDDWHVQQPDLHQGREESLVGHVQALVQQAQEVQQVVGGVHHHHVGGVQSYGPKCAQHLLHTIGVHTLHIQGGDAGNVHPGEKAQDPLIHGHQIEEQDTAQSKLYRELGVHPSGPEHRIHGALGGVHALQGPVVQAQLQAQTPQHYPGLVGHVPLLSQHLGAHISGGQIVCGESASLVHMQSLHCLHGGSLRQELSQGQHSRRGGGEQIVTIQDRLDISTVPTTFCASEVITNTELKREDAGQVPEVQLGCLLLRHHGVGGDGPGAGGDTHQSVAAGQLPEQLNQEGVEVPLFTTRDSLQESTSLHLK